ncbi:MAG: AAA family ATPase [Syntrophobacteraceae bacterium]
MKIIGIKFKNISSLSGEWDIRFDRPPLSDTGLFAIVGPNGSGKSSILDALTLGLYGETVRLRNPETDVTSWRADESYSEVTFRVAEALFCSRWWIRKGPEGPQGPEMSLSEVNGTETLLEDRVIRVRARVAELTGLDFKRFCRSVLLAQGEFAAFLNALENERIEILEKIIGTEMTRELEETIQSRVREEQERLQQLKESAASYPVLDRGRVDELVLSLEQGREQHDETRRKLSELEASRDWLQTVSRLEAEDEDAAEAMDEAKARSEAIGSEINRLEQARGALPFADELHSLETLSEHANAIRDQLLAVEREIPANEARLQEEEERFARNRLELEQARRGLDERSAELADALDRDRVIEAEAQRFLHAVSRYEAVERSRKEILQQREDLETKFAELTRRADRIRRSLDERAADSNLAAMMEKLESLASRLSEIRQQLGKSRIQSTEARKAEAITAKGLKRAERAEHRARHKADSSQRDKEALERHLTDLLGTEDARSFAAGIQARKKQVAACKELLEISHRFQEEGLTQDIGGELDHVTSLQEALGASLAEDREQLRELESQIVWRDTFRRLSGERSVLKSGDPCPLCGAMAHPFLEEGLPDLSELNRTVDALEKRIRSVEGEMDGLSEQAARLEARLRAAETMQADWTAVCERAGGSWAITDVGLIQDEIRVQEAAIKRARSLVRSSRWTKWRLAWVGLHLGRRLGKLSRREKDRARLEEQHASEQRVLQEIDEAEQRFREEEVANLTELTALGRDFGESLPETGGEAALLDRLRARSELYLRESRENVDLTLEIRSIEEQREALSLDLERCLTEAEALASETEASQTALAPMKAEREALYADLDPEREQQVLEGTINRLSAEQGELAQEIDKLFQTLETQRRSLPQLEKDHAEAKAACESAEQDVLARMADAGIESLDAARRDVAILKEEELIREQASVAAQTLNEAVARAAAAREALEAARSERTVDATLEGLVRQIDETTKAVEAIEERVGDVDRLLDEQRRLERERLEVLEAVENQERVCAEVTAEERMLRAEDGAEIRRRLQRLMLDRLVEQSNIHLGSLSGRYALRTVADNGLAFEVEDLAQQKSHRSVKTLSGGESFLVSLSLALALSDLAANHRKIESLFLDEGFGALDDETLYRVMAALKGLHSNGKLVGVISHVKRLADEIPTQIRVERESGGKSRLTVVA